MIMMKKIKVTLPAKSTGYTIFIGESIIETIGSIFDFSKYSKIAIITGIDIPDRWLKILQRALPLKPQVIIIPSGEKYKNIETVIGIWDELQKQKMDRKSVIINLGGGVVCDIGGFAAGTYLRGIDFIHVPTTVLSQVDASVGGKVGINFASLKNYIGLFKQPAGVIVDLDTLSTLPQRDFNQGFAEIIKHGLIVDNAFFDLVTSKKPQEFDIQELIKILTWSLEIKSKIVMEDEKEGGLRKLVNFGHTIGHAIESLSLETNKPFLHGEAVHLGMIAETRISELIGLLKPGEAGIIYERLSRTGLPVTAGNIKIESILSKLMMDKKVIGGQINWTLLKSIGEGVIDQKIENDIVENSLKYAIIK